MNIILKEIRKRYNLTQTEFAIKVGVSRSAIAQIESGKNNISLELAKRISEIFSIPLNNILENDLEGVANTIYNDSENHIWDSLYGEITIIEGFIDKIAILKLLISKIAEEKKLKGITPNFDRFCKKYSYEKLVNEFSELRENEITQKKLDDLSKILNIGIDSLHTDLYNNLSVAYGILAEYYKL